MFVNFIWILLNDLGCVLELGFCYFSFMRVSVCVEYTVVNLFRLMFYSVGFDLFCGVVCLLWVAAYLYFRFVLDWLNLSFPVWFALWFV